MIPPQGTREFEEFVAKAMSNPGSPEALVLDSAVSDAKRAYSEKVRTMLKEMQELVPGQLFRDIQRFHEKFGLPQTQDPGHRLTEDQLKFRIKFMFEELFEYCKAVGIMPLQNSHGYEIGNIYTTGAEMDAEEAFDALIDLAYVCLGTAYLHRFNFNEGWARVQAANMSKVRAVSADQSKRGSTQDVVKPPGWRPPDHKDLIGVTCGACGKNSLVDPIGSLCNVEMPSGKLCGGKFQ